MIKNLILQLREHQDFSVEENVERFEELLSDLADTEDSDIIIQLIPFFDDECEYPEIMFSIVHTIENFADNEYLNKFIIALPKAWKKSPYWVKVLHHRIFNSETCFQEYIKQFKKADSKLKDNIRQILNSIGNDSSKLKDRCSSILSYSDRIELPVSRYRLIAE